MILAKKKASPKVLITLSEMLFKKTWLSINSKLRSYSTSV